MVEKVAFAFWRSFNKANFSFQGLKIAAKRTNIRNFFGVVLFPKDEATSKKIISSLTLFRNISQYFAQYF
jgi:hypothetical protein